MLCQCLHTLLMTGVALQGKLLRTAAVLLSQSIIAQHLHAAATNSTSHAFLAPLSHQEPMHAAGRE